MPDSQDFRVRKTIEAILFADATREDLDINQIFETEGAKTIDFVLTGSRNAVVVPNPVKISGLTFSNIQNSVDGDLGTAMTLTGNQGSNSVYRWDFGSIATRILGLKLSGSVGAAGTDSAIVVAISDDDIAYTDIADTTPNSSSYNVTEEVSRSFRFVRVTMTSSGTGGTFNHTWFEVYDASDGLGSATFRVEKQDPVTMVWSDLIPESGFSPPIISTLDPRTHTKDVSAFPVAVSRIRGRTISTGKVSYRINMSKIFSV